nr:MAG TPA: hypothetical protein [Bacteriophage sp.]
MLFSYFFVYSFFSAEFVGISSTVKIAALSRYMT